MMACASLQHSSHNLKTQVEFSRKCFMSQAVPHMDYISIQLFSCMKVYCMFTVSDLYSSVLCVISEH